MCQGDSAQTVKNLEDLLFVGRVEEWTKVFVGRVDKGACASPPRSLVTYLHHDTKTLQKPPA